MGAGINLFKTLFPSEFYPFTANSLMSAKPTGKKIVGKNILDITAYRVLGDWTLTNGVLSANNNVYNPYASMTIKGFGTQMTISMSYQAENDRMYALQMYDLEAETEVFRHEFLQANNSYSQTFTLTMGKQYEIRIFGYGASSGSMTISNMMLQFGSTATAYEPYSETTIVYSGNELRGLIKVGTNGLYADGDIDDGSGSTDIRYELLDMSTIQNSIEYNSTLNAWIVYQLNPAKYAGWNGIPNIIDGTGKIATSYGDNDKGDNKITTDSAGHIIIGNNSSVDKPDWCVIFERATPTTATSTAWSNPIQAKQGGTETFVDTRTIALPTGHDTIYGNICDIEGWDDCTVSRNGVNQWDEITETGSIDSSTGANASDSSMLRSKNYIEVKAGKSYYCHTNNHNVYIYGYDINKAFVSAIGTATKDASITIPNDVEYIRFVIESSYGTTYNHDISINYPATKTDYNEFEGISNTFEFDNTVFGGVLDVSTGVLKLSCVLNTLGAFNYTYSDGYFKTNDLSLIVKAPADASSKIKSVCEALVYRTWNELANYDNSYAFDSSTGELRIKCSEITDASSFKSLMRNIHILYEVINPVEIQLTAWEIISLIGENNIFATTGAISSCIYEKDGAEHEASGDIITFTINAHDIISDTLKNRLVTGNYENVRLKIGANTITFVGLPDLEQNIGEVDELSVSNYSRWL